MVCVIQSSETRNEYLDIVKYFTIFCVLWGHVVQQSCMLENPNIDYIYRIIYTFHMPLFMGLCGYFFAKSIMRNGRNEYIKKKLKGRILGLIIPMISFGVLKSIVNYEFGIISYLCNVHDIWFLGDLLINTLLTLFVLKYCNDNFCHDIKYFIGAMPLTLIPLIGYGAKGWFMYLFFVGGYCFAAYYKGGFVFFIKYWKLVFVTFILAFIVFDLMPYEPSNVILSRHEPFRSIVVSGLKLVMGVTGCYLILLIIYKMMPYFKNTSLECCAIERGRYTLDIYLLNII